MASRNGLNPKIKGPKGVGFNRALPSAFGFGNGIKPNNYDANNNFVPGGYLNVSRLAGTVIPNRLSIEFWINPSEPLNRFEGFMEFKDNHPGSVDGGDIRLQGQPSGNGLFQFLSRSAGIGFDINLPSNPIYNQRNHIVFTIDSTIDSSGMYCTVNGGVGTKSFSQVVVANPPYNAIFEFLYLFTYTGQGLYSTIPTDEFRMYDKILTDEEIVLNWNNGLGNNPSTTENLFLWYIFEKFELLDFSPSQDGSNMQIGIRDLSNKFNHGLSVQLITDQTNPNYCIIPF